MKNEIIGKGGRTRTHGGLQTLALEANAIAAMRLSYISTPFYDSSGALLLST